MRLRKFQTMLGHFERPWRAKVPGRIGPGHAGWGRAPWGLGGWAE